MTTQCRRHGRKTAVISQREPAGVDGVHTEHLDDAVHGVVGVGVQLDEGVGAVGEPVDLAGRRERRLVDEGEILVAGDGLVRIHIGEVEEVALRPVQIRDDVRVEIGQADLVNVRPYKHVQPAAAGQGVLAIAAVDDVRSVVADDAIVVEAAGQIDIRRPDGLQNLDLGIEPDVEVHAGQYGVETFAFVCRRAVDVTVFEEGVADIIDDIGIVASPAAHVIGSAAAIDDVVSRAAEDEVVELIAGEVDGRRANAAVDLQLLDLRAGRQGVARAGDDVVPGAFAGIFPDDVAGVVDVISVAVGAAIHDVGAAAADEIVLAGLAAQYVALAVADQDVLTSGAGEVFDADELGMWIF